MLAIKGMNEAAANDMRKQMADQGQMNAMGAVNAMQQNVKVRADGTLEPSQGARQTQAAPAPQVSRSKCCFFRCKPLDFRNQTNRWRCWKCREISGWRCSKPSKTRNCKTKLNGTRLSSSGTSVRSMCERDGMRAWRTLVQSMPGPIDS